MENLPSTTMETAILEVVKRDDVSPERLEKFMDLQFRYEDRQSKKKFNIAMAKFQGECPIITKKKKVEFGKTKYDFAPLDEIVNIVKPILLSFGLSYSFDVDLIDDKKAKLSTIISHEDGFSKTFNHFFNPIHDDTRMNFAQREKSALSYAKRAGLENALGIVTQGEDDDAIRAYEKDDVISIEQYEDLKELCVMAEADEVKVLQYINSLPHSTEKFSKLSEIKQMDYQKAMDQLNQKLKGK